MSVASPLSPPIPSYPIPPLSVTLSLQIRIRLDICKDFLSTSLFFLQFSPLGTVIKLGKCFKRICCKSVQNNRSNFSLLIPPNYTFYLFLSHCSLIVNSQMLLVSIPMCPSASLWVLVSRSQHDFFTFMLPASCQPPASKSLLLSRPNQIFLSLMKSCFYHQGFFVFCFCFFFLGPGEVL